MLKSHNLGNQSYLYKANSVSWSLTTDYAIKNVNDPAYNKTKFELNWGMFCR
jgi:hypothetical protein